MTKTYCKAIPTTSISNEFEQFLFGYAKVFREAVIATVDQVKGSDFKKSTWNTHLQNKFGINKRHANGVIAKAKGQLDSAKECRRNHISQLNQKLKSAKRKIKRYRQEIKSQKKFYAKKNWQSAKTSCLLPAACYIDSRKTHLQSRKFALHNKTRYVRHLEQKIEKLKTTPIHVKLPHNDVFIVGSKDETLGNQVCQWDGKTIRFRVPKCLESENGKHVECFLGGFDRNIDRLPEHGAKTWHFYRKNGRWIAACSFTPAKVERFVSHSRYGCIGIDINPSKIGWAYVDRDGNLKAKGQLHLLQGTRRNQNDQQITDACLQLVTLAKTFGCPIVHEKLDFSAKKAQLREQGKKQARMLSSWAYSRFIEMLTAIAGNRGGYTFGVNPAYTSLIGLVKWLRQYGLSSDTAAAMAIARRGMRLSERLPSSINALLGVKPSRHIWSQWNQLNKQIKENRVKRHCIYSVANCDDWAKLLGVEPLSSGDAVLSNPVQLALFQLTA